MFTPEAVLEAHTVIQYYEKVTKLTVFIQRYKALRSRFRFFTYSQIPFIDINILIV